MRVQIVQIREVSGCVDEIMVGERGVGEDVLREKVDVLVEKRMLRRVQLAMNTLSLNQQVETKRQTNTRPCIYLRASTCPTQRPGESIGK